MIVPRNRLLLWFAVVVPPLCLLGATEPSGTVVALTGITGFIIVAFLDAAVARKRVAGISVETPPVARMSKDRGAKLEVRIRNESEKPGRLRLALPMPRAIESREEEMEVALPAGIEWSRVAWECKPRQRGLYRLDNTFVEWGSALGLWGARRKVALSAELRVYPNLLKDRRELATLFLHRGGFGLHAQRQLGKGREFEKLREYIPGDSFDEIHWKATARRGRPITKTYQIERTQEIYVVIDASRLSARAIQTPRKEKQDGKRANAQEPGAGMQTPLANERPETALERFITAALMLGLAAEQQGDFFGVLAFTNRVGNFVRARNGQAHYSACRDALYRLEPELVSPDYDELCTFIRLRLRRRALLVFLTALDDPVVAENFVKNVDLICRHHIVLVNMLQPAGVGPMFSDPDVFALDDLYQRLGGHLLWHNLRELERVLQRRGVRFSLMQNERLSSQLVAQYLNVKRRQQL
jgi:uncharacterized protein (DUF58 family)